MDNLQLNIKIDPQIQRQAQQIFDELGLDMSTAVNIFLRQSIRKNGLPFDVSLDAPNAETLQAFAEGDRMLRDPATKRFSSVEALFEDLNG